MYIIYIYIYIYMCVCVCVFIVYLFIYFPQVVNATLLTQQGWTSLLLNCSVSQLDQSWCQFTVVKKMRI